MPKCYVCNDTGIDETGNNDLPCRCPAGATAQFNITGVKGLVTGAEVRRHFLNGSPEPIDADPLNPLDASEIPGRPNAKR